MNIKNGMATIAVLKVWCQVMRACFDKFSNLLSQVETYFAIEQSIEAAWNISW